MPENMLLTVNGRQRKVKSNSDVPLLLVLRNDLELNGPKFGCGLGQCGSCTVIADGRAIRSCITPVERVADSNITSLEGLGTRENPHPIQEAFIDEQAIQCGFCANGVILTAKAFLDRSPEASDDELREALSTVLCRCGSHLRMLDAIRKYAQGVNA